MSQSQAALELHSRRERTIVWVLAAVAAIRVFACAAAFPFFGNVDEQSHYDLVVKYSHGQVPRERVTISDESARSIAIYGSPEFFFIPDVFPAGKFPPPAWKAATRDLEARVANGVAQSRTLINHEAFDPPLYYALAGGWLDVGRLVGLRGGFLLYWIRLLNVPIAAALVWLAYLSARLIFFDRPELRMGAPLLLAVLPQDAFYCIESDVVSPLCFGVAFVGLIKWLRTDLPRPRLAIVTGLALAGAALVKASNWPLVGVALAAVAFKTWRLMRTESGPKERRVALSALMIFVACVALPMGIWLLRNWFVLGDPSGSADKIQILGWTRKPISQWWPHPLFTPTGLGEFLSELMASFWRGELLWHGERLANFWMDIFYWSSSLIFLSIAICNLLSGRPPGPAWRRQSLCLAFWSFAASIGLLVVMSLGFDFGGCVYPSREHPIFTSGRLLSGAMIPFCLLYVYGIDRALRRWQGPWPRCLALGTIVLAVTVSEITLTAPVFHSEYNWFHFWNG